MTMIVGRRAMPRSVRRARLIVGLTATVTSLMSVGLLFVYPWQAAALVEPVAVFYWFLCYYLGRGQEWARIVTWVIFSGALVSSLLLLSASLGTVDFDVTLTALVGTTLNLTACISLASTDSTEYFSSQGLITRTVEPLRNTWAPALPTERVQAQASGPGWYSMEQNPNIQTYWDGTGWVQRRQWTPAGYAILPLYEEPEPTQAGPEFTESTRLPSLKTVLTIIIVALIPPVAALATINTILT